MTALLIPLFIWVLTLLFQTFDLPVPCKALRFWDFFSKFLFGFPIIPYSLSLVLHSDDRLFRAFLHTDTAAYAFLLINDSVEIFYPDCFLGAILHADTATDTACCTGLHGHRALVYRAASHFDLGLIGHQGDQMSGAYGDTFSAGLTFFSVYHCHAVLYMDSIKGTQLFAGTVP